MSNFYDSAVMIHNNALARDPAAQPAAWEAIRAIKQNDLRAAADAARRAADAAQEADIREMANALAKAIEAAR